MKRGEKPDGHRQMRPKTFPASSYSANSQQMLQEIRNSLRNLSKPSDPPKAESAGKMLPEDSRQQRRTSNPKNPHHKALQEIREALQPFASTEPVFTAFEENRGAALDYMGKVSYQDSREPKPAGPVHVQHPILRRPSWKGSKESLAPRHLMPETMYRSDSPGPQAQRVNPPLPPQVRSITPPPNRGPVAPAPAWDSNPATKRYSGNLDYAVPRISPVPQGAWPDSYPSASPQNQRGMGSTPAAHPPIIMQSSGATKFTFPSSWSQNGSPQTDFLSGGSRQPPPPYPAAQMQAGGSASSPSYVNGGNMVPNRNSHNLDLYNLGPPQSWSQAALRAEPQASAGSGSNQDLSPSWQHSVLARTNSFNNHQLSGRVGRSQPSATTVTAVTHAPILQPVKSIRVQKPELHTAVAPTHPPWIQQAPPPAPVPPAPVPAEVPSYQGPPPPLPQTPPAAAGDVQPACLRCGRRERGAG